MLKFLSRHTKWIAAFTLLGILLVGSLSAAYAAPPSQDAGGRQGLFGTVTAKGDNSFTIMTKQGSNVVLTVTTNTQFSAPGQAEASFAKLMVGSRVAVLAEGQAGTRNALRVMLTPSEPQREHRVLTVVDVSGKTVIAQDVQGNRIEVELDHEPGPEIKGQLITFIGAKSQQSNRFKANADVKIGQVVKRLEGHSKKLEAEAKGEANPQAKAKKEKDLAELRERLEANMQRHMDLFAEIIAKAPAQAKASLEAARQASLQGYKTAVEALGESKANAEARLRLRTLQGSVKAINTQANEVTLELRGGATINLKVTGDTKIFVGDKPGNLTNVAVGDEVKVRYNGETLVAAEVRVETGAEVSGTIKSVDTTSGQLVIALASGATLTLKLTPATEVKVNHKKAASADLKANAMVEVEYNLKTMEAREVEASTRAEVKGTVKAVDATAGTVTILAEGGKEVTVKVTSTTKVNIQGLLFGILGISPGMTIKAEFDLATGEATNLQARGEGPSRPQIGAPGGPGDKKSESGGK